METSTTSSDLLSGNSITSSSTSGDNSKTWIYIVIFLLAFGFLYYVLSNSAEQENMSGGTLSQMYAQDAQDTYLKGNVDQLATGNYILNFNHPTRIASGYGFGNGTPNRGQLLSTIPQVSVNPSPFSSASSQKSSKQNVNVPSLLDSVDNTPFPRINPKSTVSPYPNIKNILINQKEDDDMMQRELSNEVIRDQLINNSKLSPRVNTMRSGAMNTLQNALVNSCKNCVFGKCSNCPTCSNGLTGHPVPIVEPDADSVASNKVDAKSIGRLHDSDSLENFDSGITTSNIPSKTHRILTKRLVRRQENFDSGVGLIGVNGIPSKMHDNLSKRIVDKHPLFANVNDNNEIENFDSGIGLIGLNGIPSKMHDNLSKRIVDKHPLFANVNDYDNDNDNVEHFDSGISSSSMPLKTYDYLSKKIVDKHPLFANINDDNNKVENFDSGIGSSGMPAKIHKKLTKKLVKKHENFNDDDNNNNPLRANTGTCANCPQARCVNCPMRTNKCSTANCALGYPCKTCKTLSFLNDRDQIVDSDNSRENFANGPTPTPSTNPTPSTIPTPSTNSVKKIFKNHPVIDDRDLFNGNLDNNSSDSKLENFECPCKRKVITGTNFNPRYLNNNEDFTSMASSNTQNRENKENFQCSLNPDSTECIGCVNQCPCRFGNCSSCPNCRRGACTSCPNSRCPCLMGRCKDCPACKSGNCPMCPKNKPDSNNKVNEKFSTVGFDSLCPCGRGRCTNCSECRMGICKNCPRSKESNNFIDLASFGDGEGGFRLGSNWNNATTSPMAVNVNDSITYYPDSYVGSYFTLPKPDIAYPYDIIPPSRTVGGLVIDSGK